jgi:hypothetical protein
VSQQVRRSAWVFDRGEESFSRKIFPSKNLFQKNLFFLKNKEITKSTPGNRGFRIFWHWFLRKLFANNLNLEIDFLSLRRDL